MIRKILVTRIVDGKITKRWENAIEEKIEDIEKKEKIEIEKAIKEIE